MANSKCVGRNIKKIEKEYNRRHPFEKIDEEYFRNNPLPESEF